ncbi:hypothetical protein HDU97_003107 [Phlyctochytrium planicorne]|nr:hypothetical protein HDU97_003059 [Phlyctochytrium planicorne]KAJ3109679.1 hypothetical protein HDU97_003107 [Phlyctochytrium planicorne]
MDFRGVIQRFAHSCDPKTPFADLFGGDGHWDALRVNSKAHLKAFEHSSSATRDPDLTMDVDAPIALACDKLPIAINDAIYLCCSGLVWDAFYLLRLFIQEEILLAAEPEHALKASLIYCEVAILLQKRPECTTALQLADGVLKKEKARMTMKREHGSEAPAESDDPFMAVSPVEDAREKSQSVPAPPLHFAHWRISIDVMKLRIAMFTHQPGTRQIALEQLENIVNDVNKDSVDMIHLPTGFASYYRSHQLFLENDLSAALKSLNSSTDTNSASVEMEIWRQNNLGCLTLRALKKELARSFFVKADSLCDSYHASLSTEAIAFLDSLGTESQHLYDSQVLRFTGRIVRLYMARTAIATNIRLCRTSAQSSNSDICHAKRIGLRHFVDATIALPGSSCLKVKCGNYNIIVVKKSTK